MTRVRVEQMTSRELKNLEEFIENASSYFASDFPNPSRHGCQQFESLRAIARTGNLPDDQLREHLFHCSECFRDFREAVLAHRGSRYRESASWVSQFRAALFRQRGPLLAFALTAIVLVGAIQVFRAIRSTAPPEVTQKPSQPVVQAPSSTDSPSAPRSSAIATDASRARSLDDSRVARLIPVEVDLEHYRELAERTRGDSKTSEERFILLPQAVIRLSVKLARNSSPGSYRVSVVDGFDQALAATRASSSDGRTLAVTLDLSSLRRQTYRLRVSRADEAPDYYPIRIGKE